MKEINIPVPANDMVAPSTGLFELIGACYGLCLASSKVSLLIAERARENTLIIMCGGLFRF